MMADIDPLERLALLNPHVQDWRRNVPSTVRIKVTAHDIAASLAHLSPPANLLARVKYARQLDLVRDLEIAIMAYQPVIMPIHHPGMLRDMIRLAIHEVFDPHICPLCKGADIFIIDGRPDTCWVCNGQQRKRISERQRARFIAIPWETWRDIYAGRYLELLSYVWALEGDVRDALMGRKQK